MAGLKPRRTKTSHLCSGVPWNAERKQTYIPTPMLANNYTLTHENKEYSQNSFRMKRLEEMSREELIEEIISSSKHLEEKDKKIAKLQDEIDEIGKESHSHRDSCS